MWRDTVIMHDAIALTDRLRERAVGYTLYSRADRRALSGIPYFDFLDAVSESKDEFERDFWLEATPWTSKTALA